jgi:hypothetical protein
MSLDCVFTIIETFFLLELLSQLKQFVKCNCSDDDFSLKNWCSNMPMYLIYSVSVLEVLNSNKCCMSALMISYALLSARWYHDWGFLLLLEIWQKSGYNCLCNFCHKSLSRLLDASVVYIHCQERMEVIGEKWQQLMAVIHGNSCWRWDALVLLSSMKVRTDRFWSQLVWLYLCSATSGVVEQSRLIYLERSYCDVRRVLRALPLFVKTKVVTQVVG